MFFFSNRYVIRVCLTFCPERLFTRHSNSIYIITGTLYLLYTTNDYNDGYINIMSLKCLNVIIRYTFIRIIKARGIRYTVYGI